jgi:hypothetical protein
VHVHDGAEILDFHVGEAPVAQDAGIVDEDMDAAEGGTASSTIACTRPGR